VISLGSDIDDIPQASQKPGVGWHEPLIEGAPGTAKAIIPACR
jgi:aminobenzoyl-glutamate utilization protein B